MKFPKALVAMLVAGGVANAVIESRKTCGCPGSCWCKGPVLRHYRWILPIPHGSGLRDATGIFQKKEVVRAAEAIQSGDIAALRQVLEENPGLASTRMGSRTLLHVATDWPGHFPNVAASIGLLVAAGSDVNGRFAGEHEETPLHWAASSDDVEALDALIDAGADIEAPGAVLGGGTALADAVGFAQWSCARRLVERGANTTLPQAAALGLNDRVTEYLDGKPMPAELNRALWYAAHGGQLEAVQSLLAAGANINWVPDWEDLSPLDAAARSGAEQVAEYLRARGAGSGAKRH